MAGGCAGSSSSVSSNGTRLLAGGGDDECIAAYMPLYWLFLAMMGAALTLWAQLKYAPWIPFSAILFCEGIALGILHTATDEGLGDISVSLASWINIDPFLLMAAFLPALLFSDAFRINIHDFQTQAFYPAALLAGPGVVLNAFLMSVVAFYFLDYGWDVYASFLFGAVMAATDPVSVVAMLESSGAPKRLTLLMSSESHMADLVSLVMFKLGLDLVTEGTGLLEDATTGFNFFFSMIVVAPLVGLVFGFAGYYVIRLSVSPTRSSDVLIQVSTTIATAYLSFLVSEHNFHSNGVVASVVSAWVIAAYAWPKFTSRETMEQVWDFIFFIGVSLIMGLAGVIWGSTLWQAGSKLEVTDLANVFVMWGFLYASRAGIVLLAYPLLWLTSGKRIRPEDAVATVFGGIRGAVTVTLAIIVLNLAEQDAYAESLEAHFGPDYELALLKFFFIVGSVTLLTNINFMAFPYLIRWLKLTKNSQVQEQLHDHVRKRVRRNAFELIDRFRADELYKDIDVHAIVDIVGTARITTDHNMGGSMRDSVTAAVAAAAHEGQAGQAAGDVIDPAQVQLGDCNLAFLKQVRGMFLSAVRAQYWEQMKEGKLPKKSAAALVLLSSVDIANDDIANKLDDLAPLRLMHRVDATPRMELALHKADVCLPNCVTVDNYFIASLANKRRVTAVYLATAFIEAHIHAEKTIAEFVGDDATIDTPEEAFVIKESRELRAEAAAFLEVATGQDNEVVNHVHTLKIANAIIEHQRLYIDNLREMGIIDAEFFEEEMEAIRADQLELESARVKRFRKIAASRARSGHHAKVDDKDQGDDDNGDVEKQAD